MSDDAPLPEGSAALGRDLARLFTLFADLVEVEGSEPAKASAYRRAAIGLRDFPGDLGALAAAGRLREIPGVGPILARKIAEYLDTGRIEAFDRLRAAVPAGVAGLLAVRGVGPKLAAACWRGLGVTDREGLRAACLDGRLATLPGVGPRRAARVLEALQAAAHPALLLAEAAPLAEAIAGALRGREGLAAVEPAGEVRRACPLVARLDFVVVGDPAAVAAALAALALPWHTPPQPAGATAPWRRVTGTLAVPGPDGGRDLPCTALVCPSEALGTALLLATASDGHLAELAAWRRDRGEGADALPLCADETAAYAALDLPWIPPELREGWGEVRAATEGRLLPPGGRLVEEADLRSELHCHTLWSDGRADLGTMAAAARARGYRHLAVTDHSGSLVVAHGLSAERLRAQRREVDRLNAAADDGFVLLQGAEVEILRDGTLDYPDDALAALDFCVASLHNAHGQGAGELTARLLRALAHPAVDVIGHPTGRRLLRRDPQPLDLDRVAEEAARRGKALEINGSPERMDLDGALARRARASGVRWFALDSDAHSPAGLADARWAIATARRAGLGPADVLNALPLDALHAWRARRGGGVPGA